MVSFDPKVRNEFSLFKVNGANNPFAPQKTSFTGGEATSGAEFSERHGVGKAAGIQSNGVHGEVTGTGKDGKHRLDMYM